MQHCDTTTNNNNKEQKPLRPPCRVPTQEMFRRPAARLKGNTRQSNCVHGDKIAQSIP